MKTSLAIAGASLILGGATTSLAQFAAEPGQPAAAPSGARIEISPSGPPRPRLTAQSAGDCPYLDLGNPPADLIRITADHRDQKRMGFDVEHGDLDGDGLEDLVVSADQTKVGGKTEAGIVAVWKGPLAHGQAWGASQASLTLEGPSAGAQCGTLTLADFNGDGHQDLVVAAVGASTVYVLLGPITLSGTRNIEEAADVILRGTSHSLARASLTRGDVNGDGMDDLLLLAPSRDVTGRRNANICYVVFGRRESSREIVLDDGLRIPGADANDGVNGSTYVPQSGLASGDFNGDGYDDLAINAPWADGPGNGRRASGEVALVFGRPVWPNVIDLRTDPAIFLYGDQPGDMLSGVRSVQADEDG